MNRVKSMEREFKTLHLAYNLGSVKYLIEKGYSNQGKYSPVSLQFPDWDNTIVLTEAGVSGNKDREKEAENIIKKWIDKGFSLATLHSLMINKMRQSGFFMSSQTLEDLQALAMTIPDVKKEIEIAIYQEMMETKKNIDSIES